MSYDSWKTTNPADHHLGRASGPYKFACLDCEWTGKGSTSRAKHYYATGHQVVYSDDPRVAQRQPRKASA